MRIKKGQWYIRKNHNINLSAAVLYYTVSDVLMLPAIKPHIVNPPIVDSVVVLVFKTSDRAEIGLTNGVSEVREVDNFNSTVVPLPRCYWPKYSKLTGWVWDSDKHLVRRDDTYHFPIAADTVVQPAELSSFEVGSVSRGANVIAGRTIRLESYLVDNRPDEIMYSDNDSEGD